MPSLAECEIHSCSYQLPHQSLVIFRFNIEVNILFMDTFVSAGTLEKSKDMKTQNQESDQGACDTARGAL